MTMFELGVKAVGVAADKHVYIAAKWWQVREFLARFQAWYQVCG